MRFLLRCFWGLPLLVKVGVLVALPLLTINGAVAFFGNSPVFPLSPLCLPAKWAALKLYARHRPSCLLRLGHGELAPIAARAERRHGLPRGLMEAVVEVESGSRAHRISYAGRSRASAVDAGPRQSCWGWSTLSTHRKRLMPGLAT
jgi:hypothetical protein